jgi:hypothetical protein
MKPVQRRAGNFLLSFVLVGASAAGFMAACRGSESGRPTNAPMKEVAGVPADDRSRCDFRGRADREVSESSGPTASYPNVRRVFGIVGEGEERRRVLLCREVDTNFDGAKDIVRTFNDKGEPLTELADSNYDGKIDTWITFARGRVSKMQIDTLHTGQADETRFYVAAKLSRAQRDTNRDGKPDVWEVYDEGKLQRVGVDVDFDGHVDRWDRDEIALRELAEQERRENEPAKPPEGAEPPTPTGAEDAGVTDARVSARKR